ncbi:MAG: hypothetical protein IKT08_09015 [Bacteroidales bacterium]|nr:hypothetical protein [Bacteroidales bacterium]
MRRILLLLTILLTLSVGFSHAQGPLKRSVPDFPFANFDRNQLLYPGDSLAMERFFDKLDTLLFTGEGHVSIMHIGGSHVQAGVFSQQMRDNLLSLCPGITAGRGLVFPFMKTNTPASYSIIRTGEWDYCRNAVAFDTRLGLAGASVTTSDPEASFCILTREKSTRDITPVFDFNYVKILGYGDNDSIVPVVHFNGKTIKGKYHAKEGSYTFTLPDYTDSLYVDFNGVPGTFTVTGVYLDNGMPGITYHGIGVNGAKVESYLNCEDLERDLQLVKPDLVIFGIGINDAASDNFTKDKFKRDYDQLIDIIQEVSPGCALLFVTNNDSYKKIKKNKYQVNPNGILAEQAFLELGKKHNAAVWDFFDIMGGLQSMAQWQDRDMAKKDKVHFTSEGYSLIGDLLFNALMDRYMEHIKNNCKQP